MMGDSFVIVALMILLNILVYNDDDMDKQLMVHVLTYFDEMMMMIFVHRLDNKDHHHLLMS